MGVEKSKSYSAESSNPDFLPPIDPTVRKIPTQINGADRKEGGSRKLEEEKLVSYFTIN